MIFVNELANIVHECCHRMGGEANKNVGDAFLMVWRLDDNEQNVLHPGKVGKFRYHHIADQAVVAFIHLITELMNSADMQRWSEHPSIRERMPDWHVQIGVGLHWGWAIEGPIGSERKIDASYLSPNVDLTSSLEEYTKVYGVPLLLSGRVFDTLSPQIQQLCRLLDCVRVTESQPPVMLYTVDIGREGAEAQRSNRSVPTIRTRESIILNNVRGPIAGALARMEAEKKAKAEAAAASAIQTFNEIAEEEEEEEEVEEKAAEPEEENKNDADDAKQPLTAAVPGTDHKKHKKHKKKNVADNYVKVKFDSMVTPFRTGIDEAWVQHFNKASKRYIQGNWTEAVALLLECQKMMPDDQPTKVLLEFMASHNNVKPDDWRGWRDP